MTVYCDSQWLATLQTQQLASFDKMWDWPITWIDTPNDNRGGWSAVGRAQLQHHHQLTTLYVKKQQNHTTRTWRHPIKGEPTFATEFRTIQYLQARGIAVPKVVFFGARQTSEGSQAVLITENLAEYQPLDALNLAEMSLRQKRNLLKNVAQTVKKMHDTGIQHRALYLKHLFVKKNADSFEVAVIDLEKARKIRLPLLQAVADLTTLNYRSTGWTKSSRLYFLKQYLGVTRLSVGQKGVCYYINQQSLRKSNRKLIIGSKL